MAPSLRNLLALLAVITGIASAISAVPPPDSVVYFVSSTNTANAPVGSPTHRRLVMPLDDCVPYNDNHPWTDRTVLKIVEPYEHDGKRHVAKLCDHYPYDLRAFDPRQSYKVVDGSSHEPDQNGMPATVKPMVRRVAKSVKRRAECDQNGMPATKKTMGGRAKKVFVELKAEVE